MLEKTGVCCAPRYRCFVVNGNRRERARARAAWAAVFIVFILAGGCGGKSTSESEPGPEVVCHVGDATYRPGESFPDEDGCNSCSCGPDGVATCTARGCAPRCESGGKIYAPGETYPAGDGCNTCFCDLGGPTCTAIDCSEGCSYGGRQYAPGESFPDEDGCNTCTCRPGGAISCTLIACPPIDCRYLGEPRFAGERFPSRDGCNSCECLIGGGVTCTEINCPCKPDAEWWRRYVGNSPSQCALIDYSCPPYTTPFSNQCGCGCEQADRCPQFQGPCVPENCALCPYSKIAIE